MFIISSNIMHDVHAVYNILMTYGRALITLKVARLSFRFDFFAIQAVL